MYFYFGRNDLFLFWKKLFIFIIKKLFIFISEEMIYLFFILKEMINLFFISQEMIPPNKPACLTSGLTEKTPIERTAVREIDASRQSCGPN